MALLTVQDIAQTGTAPAYVAAGAGGDTFDPGAKGPNAKVLVHLKNGSGGSITVTVDDPTSASPPNAQAFNPDVQVAIPAGQERMILLDPIGRFLNPTTGLVALAYSGVTSLTVAVFRAFT